MSAGSADGAPRAIVLAYALPAFVVALPTIPVFIQLPALYGVDVGLGLTATGLVLLLARLFDALSDPLVGALSDRYALRGNRRKPWIGAGALIAGFGLYWLLNPPPDAGPGYLFTWSIVLYAGWTMVQVPYLAWGAELDPDYDGRTRVAAWREGCGLLGILAAGGLGALAGAFGQSGSQSTSLLAWTAIVLGAAVFPLLLWKVPETPAQIAPRPPASLARMWAEIASLLDNGPFVRLLSAWFLNGLANGVPAALFFVYLEHGLGVSESLRPVFILAYFVAAVASVPLWPLLSRKFGKHRTWCMAMAVTSIAFAAVPFIDHGQFAAFAMVCAVTGLGLGADLVLPPAIQSDVTDYDRLRSGRSRTGLQFALWSLATKLALAASVGMALPAVELAGFDPEAPTPSGIHALTVIYAQLPVVIKLTAVAIVWRFPLTGRKHSAIRRRLAQRQDRQRLSERATG